VTELDFAPQRTALVLIDLMPRIIALHTVPGTGEQVLSRCLGRADCGFRRKRADRAGQDPVQCGQPAIFAAWLYSELGPPEFI
jgi:hypothetical protein